MIDIEKIQEEIDIVKNLNILNISDIENLKDKYLSKNGMLPYIYNLISKMKGSKSSYYLNKMLELRESVDNKIKLFIQ